MMQKDLLILIEIKFYRLKDNPDYQMIVVKFNGIIVGFAKVIIHHDIFEENNPFITLWSICMNIED